MSIHSTRSDAPCRHANLLEYITAIANQQCRYLQNHKCRCDVHYWHLKVQAWHAVATAQINKLTILHDVNTPTRHLQYGYKVCDHAGNNESHISIDCHNSSLHQVTEPVCTVLYTEFSCVNLPLQSVRAQPTLSTPSVLHTLEYPI